MNCVVKCELQWYTLKKENNMDKRKILQMLEDLDIYMINNLENDMFKNSNRMAVMMRLYQLQKIGQVINQNGEKVDYRNFTKEGHYDLEIVASDDAGNKSSPQKATLIIGKNDTYKPITCNYGNGEYDETNIIAVNVTNGGCAIDLNLYDNEEVLAPINKIKDSEKEKLKKEFSKINLGVKNIYINTDITTVLNTAGKGVVGYTLKVTVSIKNNNKEEVIEEYYVNLNGGREYIINKYLQEFNKT